MSEARQTDTTAPELLVSQEDGIGRITLNRPEIRNPLSLDFAEAMNAALDQLEDDPDCRVIILTGNGPVFCGGAQLGSVLVIEEVDMDCPGPADYRRRQWPGSGRRRLAGAGL